MKVMHAFFLGEKVALGLRTPELCGFAQSVRSTSIRRAVVAWRLSSCARKTEHVRRSPTSFAEHRYSCPARIACEAVAAARRRSGGHAGAPFPRGGRHGACCR